MKNKNKSIYNIRKKRKRQNKKIPLRQHTGNITLGKNPTIDNTIIA